MSSLKFFSFSPSRSDSALQTCTLPTCQWDSGYFFSHLAVYCLRLWWITDESCCDSKSTCECSKRRWWTQATRILKFLYFWFCGITGIIHVRVVMFKPPSSMQRPDEKHFPKPGAISLSFLLNTNFRGQSLICSISIVPLAAYLCVLLQMECAIQHWSYITDGSTFTSTPHRSLNASWVLEIGYNVDKMSIIIAAWRNIPFSASTLTLIFPTEL